MVGRREKSKIPRERKGLHVQPFLPSGLVSRGGLDITLVRLDAYNIQHHDGQSQPIIRQATNHQKM